MRYPTNHKIKPDLIEPDDRIRQCCYCNEFVLIPKMHCGGFWWLSGFLDKSLKPHFGGYCNKCFDEISKPGSITGEQS